MLTKTLKNGLKTAIVPLSGTEAVTVLVLVKTGSRYEDKKLNGIAHFTEHLFFKGTKKRPSTLKISQELDSIGADYNAFTSKEYTGYYIKTSHAHLPLAVEILSDMIRNSLFSKTEIDREKGVIIEEINMYEDAPMMMLDDVFDEGAYQGNPLAWNIAGSKQTVSQMKRADFVKFKNKYYQPDNMIISIAGRVTKKEVDSLLNKYFAYKGKKTNTSYRPSNLKQKKPRVIIKHKKTEQVHLALGAVGKITPRSPHLLPLKIAQVAVGGNMSSRLFINIRERQGLCYYIRSRVNTYQDVGNFTIYAGLDKERINMALKLIGKEMEKIVNNGLGRLELKKAKEFIKGKTILALEDSAAVSQWYGESLIFEKKIKTPDQYLKKIEAVSLQQVNKSLSAIFKKKYLNLALIGDLSAPDDFLKIMHNFTL